MSLRGEPGTPRDRGSNDRPTTGHTKISLLNKYKAFHQPLRHITAILFIVDVQMSGIYSCSVGDI